MFSLSLRARFALAIGLVLLIVLGVAFGRAHRSIPSKELPIFRVGVNTWVGFAPFWLAQDKGFFEEEGIKVEILTSDDPAQRKAAILHGDLDGVGDPIDTFVLGRAVGVPSVAVAELDVSLGADGILVVDSIKTIEGLRGKQIAVQKNFVSEAFLQYVLERHGMSLKDVWVIDMEAGAAGAAFASGKVDVAVTFEPWLTKAKKERAGTQVLVSSADEPGILVDIFTVREAMLKDHPERVKKVLRAWFKAVEFWRTHPDEANLIMAKHYQVPPTEFAELISGLTWTSYADEAAYFGTADHPGKIFEVAETFATLFHKAGTIATKPDLSAAIDSSLIRTLYAP